MPDRAKIISQLASKAKMDPSSATTKKDIKLMKKVEPLPTPKDKEEEVEDLLTESEKEMEKQAEDNAKDRANYDRIQEQGMSDQGIVNMDQLVDAGKKVYRKVKSKVKKMME